MDEIRTIKLPGDRGILEVTMTPQFITELRKRFMLADDQPVEDDHIRMFVWGAVKNAIDKAEAGVE